MTQGESVKYLGRSVPKDGFRTYIYGPESKKKLVNSWDEYEAHISNGLWFSSKKDVDKRIASKEKK